MKECNDRKFKVIDFFCGGGGVTCGLRQAGIDVIAGVEISLGQIYINKALNN